MDNPINFEMSPERDQLFAALVNALPEIPTVPKNGKAQRNKHRVIDDILDAVKPILKQYGLFITLCPVGKSGLFAMVGHTSGQFMKFSMQFPDSPGSAHMSEQHALGSDITYFKRYMIDAILGIVSEEDTDGNQPSASNNSSGKKEFIASPDKPSSEKQHNYIKSLCKQKDSPDVRELLKDYEVHSPEDLVGLNQLQAKTLIDTLQKL